MTSAFDPSAAAADEIFVYSRLVIGICAGIFAVVSGLFIVVLVRFRHRAGSDEREPPQVYGSNQLELAWTVVPVIIVFILSIVTARTIAAVQIDRKPAGWMEVIVTGHQWWWEFEYPQLGIVTANELHLPVSGPEAARPVFLTLRSSDVIHSFWIPQLAGKMDLVPRRENHLWLAPERTGVLVGQCAEFCGTQHANMLLRVVVHSGEEFDAWARAQRRPAVDDPRVGRGRDLFLRTACINCHTVRGTAATGRVGPDLTHLMSRATLGAGVATNDAPNLRRWILDPAHLKPGARMPSMGLGEEALDQVVAYLASLE